MDKAGLAALVQDTGYSTGDPILDTMYGVEPLTEEELAAYLPPETPTAGYGPVPEISGNVRQRAEQLAPIYKEAAEAYGLDPAMLMAVHHQESKFDPAATSPRGAIGTGQFMPNTWKQWGQGDPRNPRDAAFATARYLRHISDMPYIQGNEDLMYAGYNAGEYNKAVKAGQIPGNPETQAYVPAVKTLRSQYASLFGGAPQQNLRSYTTPSGQTISVPADLSDDEIPAKMLAQYPDQARQLGFTPPEEANLESFKTPSGQEIKVPKGLTPDQIAEKMLAQYPEQAKKLGFKPPKVPETGAIAALTGGFKAGVGKGAEFAGEVAHRAGYEDFAQKAGAMGEEWKKAAEQTYREMTPEEIQQQGLWGKAKAHVVEPLLHGVGEYGGPVAASMLAPEGAVVLPAAGVLGTVAVGGGTALEEAKAAGKTLSNLDLAKHTAVETIANYLRIPLGKLAPLASRLSDDETRVVIDVLQKQGPDAAAKMAGSYLGELGKNLLATSATGAAGSAVSEANRLAIEGKDLTSPEARQRMLESAEAGAMAIAPLGALHGHMAHGAREAQISELARGHEDLQRQLGRSQQERDLEQEVDEQGYTPEMRQQIEAARQKLQERAGVTQPPPPPPPGEEGAPPAPPPGEPTPPPPPPGEGEAPPKEQAPPEVTPPEPLDLTKATRDDIETSLTKLNEQSNAFLNANDYDNYDLVQDAIQAHEAELRKRDAEDLVAKAPEGKKEEIKTPPAAEAPAPEITHFVDRLKFKKPGANLRKRLANLDPNNPEDLQYALNQLHGMTEAELPGVEALRQDLNRVLANQPPLSPLAGVPKKAAPTEAPSAQQIPETGAPDGSGGAQPILREEGGDQAVSGKGVEPSGQGIETVEAKAEEEKVAADWNKNKAADTPVWNMIPEGVRELYRADTARLESPEDIYDRYEFNESGKTWDLMKQPETPAWGDLGTQHKVRVDFTDARKRGDFVLPENLLEPEKKAETKPPDTTAELEAALAKEEAAHKAQMEAQAEAEAEGKHHAAYVWDQRHDPNYSSIEDAIDSARNNLNDTVYEQGKDHTYAGHAEKAFDAEIERLLSKEQKAPKEPLTEAVTEHVEATTVPRRRGRPSLSPEEKAAREATKTAKRVANKEQKRVKAEDKKTKPTRQQAHDATQEQLDTHVKVTKEALDATPKPDATTFDPKNPESWSQADADWVRKVIDHTAARRDAEGHRANAKHLSDAEQDTARAEAEKLERHLIGLTQAHRAAEHSLLRREETKAPEQEAAVERVTYAEAAEAWNTDKPEAHAAWEDLTPAARARWHEAVNDGVHLHPESNKALRNEIEALNNAEATAQEHAREGRINRGLGFEAVDEKGTLRVPHSLELAGALTTGVKEKDIGKVAQALIDQQRNPIIKSVAEHVKKIITSGIKITEASMDDARLKGHGAFYDPATNTIHIASSHLMDAPTIAHEMVHALTHYVLDNPKSLAQKTAVHQLKQLFDAVKDHESIKGKYGVKDIHEFVAEGFSNPEFQRALAKIPYKTQTAWTKFAQKIAQMLGLHHDNALTELLSATDKLMPSKKGATLKTDAKKGLLYAPKDDDARLLSEARLTRTLPSEPELLMKQAEDTLNTLRKPGAFGELFANLRYGLISKDSKLAYALRNDPTFQDGKFRADLLLSQYGHLNQFVSEGIRLGIPFRTSTGMMKIATDPNKNLIAILNRAHDLPKELGNGPDALANTLRALIGEHWMKEPERLRDRIAYLKSDEVLVREHAQTLSGEAKTEALRTANKLRREVDHAQERLDRLPETGLEIKVQPDHIDAAKRMMEKYPELKRLVDDVHGVMRGLVDLHESVGLIDSFTARQWRKAPYIPLYMSMEDLAKREGEGKKVYGASAKGLRAVKQKGVSEHEVNVFENLQKHYFWMTQTAFQNNVRRGAMEQLGRWGMAERLSTIPKTDAEKAKLVLTREFGNDVWHKVDDPYIVDVMSFPTPEALPSFLTTPSRAFSRLTLMNPGYWFKQLVRDPFVANFVSRTGLVTPLGAARSFLKIVTGTSPEYEILRAHGVTGLVDALNDSVRFSQGAGKPNALRTMWDKLKHIHEAADAATRVEVYKQAMKEAKKKGLTGDVAESFAVSKAREIINFSNQGANQWVNYFSRTVPFFSAGLNSLDVIARGALGTNLPPAEAAHARKLFRNRALVMTAASTAYAYHMAMSSQAYRDSSDHDWTNAWLIEPPESWGWAPGRMIKIASPFEIGFMFKFLPELAVRNLLGLTGPAASKELAWDTFKQTFPVQPFTPLGAIPTIFRPMVEVAANYNFFGKYGIETPSMQMQEVKTRGADKASTLANWLAENTPERAEMSPAKWDHLLSGYFSETYKMAMMLADMMVAPEGKMTAKDITEKVPLARVLVTNPNHYSGADDFYDMKQSSERFKNTFVRARKQGDMARVEEMLGRPGGIDKYGAAAIFNKQGEMISRFALFKQQITNSNLSPEEKRERLDALNKAQKNLVQFYGNVSKGMQQRIEEAEDAAEEDED